MNHVAPFIYSGMGGLDAQSMRAMVEMHLVEHRDDGFTVTWAMRQITDMAMEMRRKDG